MSMTPVSEERLKLEWLIGARWWACLGLLLSFLVGHYAIGLTLDASPFVALLTLLAVSNLVTGYITKQPTSRLLIGMIFADIILFTALLYFYGGSTNPLSSIYFLYVILSAILLPPFWGWLTAAFTSLCFTSLFFIFVPIPEISGHHAHHHQVDAFSTHLQGMLITFVFTAFVIVYFVSRLTEALKERGLALETLKERHRHSERLAALTTLAAGAAHELRNPLAAISIAIGELDREIHTKGAMQELLPEIHSVKQAVSRCQGIIDGLSANAGVVSGEPLVSTTIKTILEQVQNQLPEPALFSINTPQYLLEPPLTIFASSLVQALLSLVRNGLAYGPVEVEIQRDDRMVRFSVRDQGPGIPANVLPRLGEPFFTTKPSGEGMGLGLFVTKTFTDRLGGTLEFNSAPGKGTVAILSIPLAP